MIRITDHPNMSSAIYCECNVQAKSNKQSHFGRKNLNFDADFT